jgi:alpha-tubulin suppressor-like RCC1 family protein
VEPRGPNCPAGGERIDEGIDTNGDGVLEPGEIKKTAYVCNGASLEAGTGGDSGTGSDASDAGAACVAGSLQCIGQQPQYCSPAGQWADFGPLCVDQACVAGQCSGVCTPGSVQCSSDGMGLQECEPSGFWSSTEACAFGACSSGACLQPVALVQGGGGSDNMMCAITSFGSVACWGFLPDTTDPRKPEVVLSSGSSFVGAVDVAIGADYACLLTVGDSVRCWGDNGFGELGDGTQTIATSPSSIVNLTAPAVGIAASSNPTTCAVLTDGTVECWGFISGFIFDSADPSATFTATPIPLFGASGATAVRLGTRHGCVLKSDSTVACWGDNTTGQLGDGNIGPASTYTPVPVQGLTGATAISAGVDYSCALLSRGTVQCWGNNADGELGNGTTTNSGSAVAVVGLSGPATGIAAGGSHTCAVLADGTVACWGANTKGELGNGTTTTGSTTPIVVSGLGGPAKAVAVSPHQSCALLADSTVRCWGRPGDHTTALTPVTVQ